jgi:hypothetical protein
MDYWSNGALGQVKTGKAIFSCSVLLNPLPHDSSAPVEERSGAKS